MKRNFLQKAGALVLAATMAISLAACGSKGTKTEYGENGRPVLDIVVASHASWPYDEDWKMWEYFREGADANLNVRAFPGSDFTTKVALMLSSPDTIPDMLYLLGKAECDSYAQSGAFVSLSSNMDKMPNLSAFLDTLPEEEADDLMLQRTSADGEVYKAPIYGTHTINNLRSWLYRKDIFEEHGIAVPTTYDEMYQAAKKLKEIYPNSYPICIRSGLSFMDVFVSGWSSDMNLNVYYDTSDSTWKYGPTQPVMTEVAEYFTKLYKEGLVPPDFLTIEGKPWEELMSTDRGFICFDYIVRIDFFNEINRVDNPNYTLASFAPPKPNVPTAQDKLTRTNTAFAGFSICNTGNQETIDEAFRVLDWMYSDKGAELLSWGKEGETFEVVDGRRQYILPKPDDTPQLLYGVGSYGILQRTSVEANEAGYTEEQVIEARKAVEHTKTIVNPYLWVPLTDEEDKEKAQLQSEIGTYFSEHFGKIIMGQEPLSSWDNCVKEMKEMGADRLVEIYSQAYERVMSK